MPEQISVAILSGGACSRMGANKAFVEVEGVPMIQRVIDRVSDLGDEYFIVANDQARYANLGIEVIPDLIPGKGPLGGLLTALTRMKNPYALVISCDQPFLNTALLKYLVTLREGYDLVVPLDEIGRPHSMHTLYGKACLPVINRLIQEDRLKTTGFFKEMACREVSVEECRRIDPQLHSFFNVNTPEDLAKARDIASGSK